MNIFRFALILSLSFVFVLLTGCSTSPSLPSATIQKSYTTSIEDYDYLIGPNDNLRIFVWRHPDLSGTFTVRPDGKVTTALVEDIEVTGRSTSMLARELEKELGKYINNPRVTVTVTRFNGPFSEQVRVIGEAKNPQSINYSENMTLLDLMIISGGLTDFADGNRAKLVRNVNGAQRVFNIYIDDLIRDGEIEKNVDILPGDIVIIPEAWF